MNKVRVRIAPSPTGFPHIGTIFQALFNYAFARHNKGKFIVRIEDTDRTRYVEGAEKAIFDALEWFGLNPDESPKHGGKYGPYRQSEKLSRYRERALWLIDQNKAYFCFCSSEKLDEMRKRQQREGKPPMYDGRCRDLNPVEAKERAKKEPHVIRMRIINRDPILNIRDDVRGVIKFETKLIDDQVILKSDGFPTYHLAVVVDDYDMKISHVIRGEEWISSTPKHVLLYRYFDWNPPSFLHTPLLRNPDGSKLSKRHSHAAVSWYREQGFLADAILNYLANLVYNHSKGEIYSLEEFVNSFEDRSKIHSVGARFDLTKLEWINGIYIRELRIKNLELRIKEFIGNDYPGEIVGKTIPLIRERIKKLSDYLPLCGFFFNKPETCKIDLFTNKELLGKVSQSLKSITDWKADVIGRKMQEVQKTSGLKTGDFFMIVRVAITGKKISPPLNESMEILGKEEVLSRLNSITEK